MHQKLPPGFPEITLDFNIVSKVKVSDFISIQWRYQKSLGVTHSSDFWQLSSPLARASATYSRNSRLTHSSASWSVGFSWRLRMSSCKRILPSVAPHWRILDPLSQMPCWGLCRLLENHDWTLQWLKVQGYDLLSTCHSPMASSVSCVTKFYLDVGWSPTDSWAVSSISYLKVFHSATGCIRLWNGLR